MDVAAAFRDSISRICDVPAEEISDDATLDDLGFDSLAAAEVLTDIEIRLGRELPVAGLRRLTEARTVGDVVALLQQELAAAGRMTSTVDVRRAGTSPAAVARHYDLSDEFFRCWLGDELVYSCALWRPAGPARHAGVRRSSASSTGSPSGCAGGRRRPRRRLRLGSPARPVAAAARPCGPAWVSR